MLNKMAVIMLCCVSLGSAKDCPKDHIDGPAGPCTAYMPRALGASPEESKKWVSDETAPGKGHQPAWETGEAKTADAPNMSESDRKSDEIVAKEIESSRPKSCKADCKWDGTTCTCDRLETETTPSGKKVTFTATAILVPATNKPSAGKKP